MTRVFVYGTLKPGEAFYQQYCAPHVVEAAPALAQGCLFHLPQGYPAMALGSGWVTGALLTLSSEAAIAPIDDFEDYDPTLSAADNLYVRQMHPVFSVERQPLGSAWAYIMAAERVRQYQGIPIATGTWSQRHWHSICPRRGIE